MSRKSWWIIFATVSLVMLGGYTVGLGNEQLQPFLKGLSSLQHFAVHYIVGIVFGLVVCVVWYLTKRRRLIEPLVLTASVLFSHFPDFRFAFRKQAHDAWEILFLGHTAVDEAFNPLFYILLFVGIALTVWYLRLLKRPVTLSR